jgi:hypothetical protein
LRVPPRSDWRVAGIVAKGVDRSGDHGIAGADSQNWWM